jgi:hypothetical protein
LMILQLTYRLGGRSSIDSAVARILCIGSDLSAAEFFWLSMLGRVNVRLENVLGRASDRVRRVSERGLVGDEVVVPVADLQGGVNDPVRVLSVSELEQPSFDDVGRLGRVEVNC